MDRVWTLSGLEFRVMMEQFGRDRLPFPMQFRPTADTAADYHRQRHEASIDIAKVMTDDLRIAVHVLLDPVYRIEIVGHTRPPGVIDPTRDAKVRAHAAVGAESATVLIQQPGLDDSSGGSVTVQLLEVHHALAAALCALPVAGRGGASRIEVPRRAPSSADSGSAQDRPSQHRQGPLFHRATGSTDQENFDRLLGHPRTGAGEILVCPGRATDSRVEKNLAGLHWIDNAGDGRYLIKTGTTVTVVAASLEDLTAEIELLVRQIPAR